MRLAVREDDDVAGLHLDLILSFEAAPGGSRKQDVVRNEMLRLGQDPWDELARRSGGHRPRRAGLYMIEVGSVEPHRAQDVGERIHARNRRRQIWTKQVRRTLGQASRTLAQPAKEAGTVGQYFRTLCHSYAPVAPLICHLAQDFPTNGWRLEWAPNLRPSRRRLPATSGLVVRYCDNRSSLPMTSLSARVGSGAPAATIGSPPAFATRAWPSSSDWS